ncbi:MaoC family dehydratase N-terminal domain-containing protein [Sphingomonas sp. AOB5]|uniref:FAS1-like dehydratase domain-containing protein n=1 Tax=Sphingomonas sp. AOB5 TaxID=3034017 RepID=UPI0023F8323F|nr:MaoC family dehydratase N-terminal domain-containing protein [Sphingomonas sp. AOB5]MDF7774786.1 MaoC family dehydratase N-terminal domain-containing protein [Sphingomonas sp. AOB5]
MLQHKRGMDIEHLKSWIGREERASDVASAAPLAGLAALLDHETPPWAEDEVPPLGHWLYFLPQARQSMIGDDGHPKRGGFLPPVPLPRRMWAGGRLKFHGAIPVGSTIERVSTIEDVTAKSGASGEMVFVTVRHAIHAGGVLAIEEWQDLVYRGESAPGAAASAVPASTREADISRAYTTDPVALFRYSALTFNGHRIHYDRDYARDVEGYPGLVVHGPLSATLLMDLFLRAHPRAAVTGFSFRARAPLFDIAPFTLNLAREDGKAALWTADAGGRPAMTAEIETGE